MRDFITAVGFSLVFIALILAAGYIEDDQPQQALDKDAVTTCRHHVELLEKGAFKRLEMEQTDDYTEVVSLTYLTGTTSGRHQKTYTCYFKAGILQDIAGE